MFKYLLGCLLCLTVTLQAQEKIIFLVSPIRSLSVAFMRTMAEREDCKVFLEPLLPAYARSLEFQWDGRRSDELDWSTEDPVCRPGVIDTAEGVFKHLFKECKGKTVFVKEITYIAAPFLIGNKEFVSDPRVRFVFLLRHPAGMLRSTMKTHSFRVADWESYLGYEEAYDLYHYIEGRSAHPIHLIKSEELAENTEKVVREFCKAVEIPFMPEALSWKPLPKDYDGKDWSDTKKPGIIGIWHSDAIASSCIRPLKPIPYGEDGLPEFKGLSNIYTEEEFKTEYLKSLVWYEKLMRRMGQ